MREMKATLLQQAESHLFKVCLVRLSAELKKRGSAARIVAAIHDSIWVEAALDDKPEVQKTMEDAMTEVGELGVPLEVDFQ